MNHPSRKTSHSKRSNLLTPLLLRALKHGQCILRIGVVGRKLQGSTQLLFCLGDVARSPIEQSQILVQMSALRAIAAVFRTPPCLDGEQAAELDAAGIKPAKNGSGQAGENQGHHRSGPPGRRRPQSRRGRKGPGHSRAGPGARTMGRRSKIVGHPPRSAG